MKLFDNGGEAKEINSRISLINNNFFKGVNPDKKLSLIRA